MPSRSLLVSRLSWFVLIGAAFAAKDACAGGGKRPDPPPPASVAPPSAPKSSQLTLPRTPRVPALVNAERPTRT